MSNGIPSNREFQNAMREVLDIIEHLPQGSQAMFLFHPKGSLGGKTPLEALALGLFDEVKQSAEGFVER